MGGLNTASSADEQSPEPKHPSAAIGKLLLAMRKVPDARPAHVVRGKRLLMDPKYPSRDVLKRVARVLAPRWNETDAP